MKAVESLVDEFEESLPFELDPFQREAIDKLERGRGGVLVSAPTSSGKTVVAEYAIFRALMDGAKVLYTTPLKALSNQKFHDFVRAYGEEAVGLVTGENTINDGAAIVVMTTEILRNLIYEDPARLDMVRYVVLGLGGDRHPGAARDQAGRPFGDDRQLQRDRRLDGGEPRRHGDGVPRRPSGRSEDVAGDQQSLLPALQGGWRNRPADVEPRGAGGGGVVSDRRVSRPAIERPAARHPGPAQPRDAARHLLHLLQARMP